MKRAKQFLSGLSAGLMIFSLAACGQQQAPSSQQSSQPEASVSSSAPEESLEDGVVRITAGLVRGTDTDGILRYLGVPYAQAAERFVPAGAVEP
jgi:para-nitrobenzyl esterase